MVYLYRKVRGNKEYYYLRASIKQGSKLITKDIAYLGSDINQIKKKLSDLPLKYSKEIKRAYKTINRFIEANRYLQEIKGSKIKTNKYIIKELLENIEACKLHWNEVFQKLDYNTKNEVFKNFLIEFAFNTTSIEGNTITLEETYKLLSENLTPKNRTLREIYDLQNTEKVFFDLLQNPNMKIDNELIYKVHGNLLNNIDERKGYRTTDVRVFKMNFKATPAPYVSTDMNLLIKWYHENENKIHPLVLATIFHYKFEKIHPFMDGNGRTGRILMNFILIKKKYPPLIFRKRKKDNYLRELNKADKSDLTKMNISYYRSLVEFSANELIDNYWNIFL